MSLLFLSSLCRMVDESQHSKDSSFVFTCMLGHKDSLLAAKQLFLQRGICSCWTEFCQGRTLRWGVAWTFSPGAKMPQVSRLKDASKTKKEKAPIAIKMDMGTGRTMQDVLDTVRGWMQEIDVEVRAPKVEEDELHFTVR